PPGLSMKIRTTVRGPCPEQTTSTNSKPSAQRIGDAISRMRSATRWEPYTYSSATAAAAITANKKVGQRPLEAEAKYHDTPSKARGPYAVRSRKRSLKRFATGPGRPDP